MKNINILKMIGSGMTMILMIGLLTVAYIQPQQVSADIDTQVNNQTSQNETNEDIHLSDEELTHITEGFMDTIVQDIDEHYKVTDFQSKDELYREFDKVATRDVASDYVDFYFKEKDNSLYLIPTETPPWFNPKNDYDMVQLAQDKVMVNQENTSELYGDYSIQLELTYRDDGWQITQIKHS